MNPAPVDLEAEYNNRARVPEHPAIFEGWRRDAAAYRAEHPAVSIPYGATERQGIDLFAADGDGPATVAFIHGGYWQGLDRSFFSHLARGLNAHGIAVALPGYDLCPAVGVGDIVEEARQACRVLWARDRRPLVVAGHSAGGHLAACLLATDWGDAAPAPIVPAACAISGLFELAPLIPTSINGALGLDRTEADRLSPLLWPAPSGLTLDAVVGADESDGFLRQSRAVVDAWGRAGVRTRFEALPGANHFTVLAPLADPGSAMVARLAELARAAGRP